MVQYSKTDSMGIMRSIILGIWEVQVLVSAKQTNALEASTLRLKPCAKARKFQHQHSQPKAILEYIEYDF